MRIRLSWLRTQGSGLIGYTVLFIDTELVLAVAWSAMYSWWMSIMHWDYTVI